MKKRTPRDFKFIRLIGEGSFSSVYLAVDAEAKSTTDSEKAEPVRKYAIKVCQKSHIKRQGKQVAIMREKEIMNILNQAPNKHFIKLYCTFQDIERLYFVMSYAPHGDLLTYMQENPLQLGAIKRYTTQLVEALEHMHKLGIVHRDLKPENILLDEYKNIQISDFGSAQIYNNESINNINPATRTPAPLERRNSFVGTAQYVSPEMLKCRQASNKSDLWALGIIIYQMHTNLMPFNAPNEYLMYQKIQNLDFVYPESFDEDARDLVNALVRLDPMDRLGALDDVHTNGYISIRRHKFLSSHAEQMESSITNDNGEALCDKATVDPDLIGIENVNPGLDEAQLLRLLTVG